MRAVDTNVLVAAHVDTVPEHETAHDLLILLAGGDLPWAIPWPCVYEFLRVVTHPRVFHPPLSADHALRSIGEILASPTVLLLSETTRHVEIMRRVIGESRASGNLVHDAHIAALCLEHGVGEILTGDQDFTRFEGLRVVNPFADRAT